MAYKATVIPVMIASPGDVADERNIIRSVIYDWNDINSATSKVILLPVGWETHISPELGERPQELINKRILKDCDLLVGVFWTRLGTPTGKTESGTVEEIEEHIKSGKPAMIYFSSKPVAPESIDVKQFEKVKLFKEKCRQLGIVEEYENIEQFKSKFSKQLPITILNNPYIQSLIQTPSVGVARSTSIEAEEIIELSSEAKRLLKAAASREDGIILKIVVLGGKYIQAGGQKFGDGRAREAAKWENALRELFNQGLVTERGYKGEVFELTYKGWEIADKL